MFEKWSKYQAEQVKVDSENGVRLISLFAKDYKKITGNDICHNCKDFNVKYQKFIKRLEEMKNQKGKNSGFVLKKMYENIPLSFGSRVYVNNENMTDEYALELINGHPRGKELFDVIPNNVDLDKKDELPEAVKSLIDNNTKAELVDLAEEVGVEEPKGNKTEIALAIGPKKQKVLK